MSNKIRITRKQAKPFLQAIKSDYRGRKFIIELTDKVIIHNTNWSGGTRNQYTALKFDTGEHETFWAPAPWVNPVEGKTLQIPAGIIIMCRVHFCGEDLGYRIYAHPSMAMLLGDLK